MSDTKEQVPAEEPVVVKSTKVTKTETVISDPQISLDQYFNFYASDVHEYTRAYVGANYRGIMKTKSEWDSELSGQY